MDFLERERIVAYTWYSPTLRNELFKLYEVWKRKMKVDKALHKSLGNPSLCYV